MVTDANNFSKYKCGILLVGLENMGAAAGMLLPSHLRAEISTTIWCITKKFQCFRFYSRHMRSTVDDRIALRKGLCSPIIFQTSH
jgi:hypothetical protein